MHRINYSRVIVLEVVSQNVENLEFCQFNCPQLSHECPKNVKYQEIGAKFVKTSSAI